LLDQWKVELGRLPPLSGAAAELHVAQSRRPGFIEIKGKELVNFTSWDFLNLNFNREFKRSAQSVIEMAGLGAASPRLCAGTTVQHLSCERALARFLGTEAALLFSSKNQAVFSLVTTLACEKDAVFYDELTHSPVADAAYLVNAEALPYSAADPLTLDSQLEKAKFAKKKLVFVESVSPYFGRKAELKVIAGLCAKHSAVMMVDESFALGAVGLRGAGACEGLEGAEVTCKYADLSLGLSAFGAVVAAPQRLIDYLVNHSRTVANEVALPAAVAGAIQAALEIVELQPLAREKLQCCAGRLVLGLHQLKHYGGVSSDTPIVSLPLGKLSQASELAGALFERSFWVEVVVQRKLCSEGAAVRFIMNTAHDENRIDELLQAISDVLPRLKDIG